MKVRIGIDVGGTFTDAVAINDETYELIGGVKTPTTHEAKEGVAAGIILVLRQIMEKYEINPADVVFIAHGTTQATNALLEGDVAKVGILTLGSGLQGMKSKADTNIGNIELAAGKFLFTFSAYVNTVDTANFEANVRHALESLTKQGAESVVVTEAFSVDNPKNENSVLKICKEMGIPGTAGNDVSKLYGLKVRTRTAVINASILPKMLDAAKMTEESIKNADIHSPLMVMRCDGGVMTVEEMRNRPILTILSGPAAGVAGALMYEKLTDGLFMEVGGTSTDISCVKDGSVVVRYAEVGGHKTYVNSLDVRTVGIGGGSMIELRDGKIVDTGPRSAHIADLDYEVYTTPDQIVDPVVKTVKPKAGDPDYAYIECANGKKFALTLSGAANIAGYVKEEDYAYGNLEAARKAWKPLADSMGLSVEDTAKEALKYAAVKNGRVVRAVVEDYALDIHTLTFVGGGGGAATVVPHLAETCGCHYKIAKNASVISPIGVALALVRDMVERTVPNPTDADILAIRQEAIRKATESGANPATIEVKVEVDAQHQKLRATAIGATELRTKELSADKKTDEELKKIVAANLKVDPSKVELVADNGRMCALTYDTVVKYAIFLKKKVKMLRLIDRDGVIRLQKRNGMVRCCKVKSYVAVLKNLVKENTKFADAGEEVPNIYAAVGSRIIDLAGMQSGNQIFSLCDVELSGMNPDMDVIFVCTRTTENERG